MGDGDDKVGERLGREHRREVRRGVYKDQGTCSTTRAGGKPRVGREHENLETIPWYGPEYSLNDLVVYQMHGHKREHDPQLGPSSNDP